MLLNDVVMGRTVKLTWTDTSLTQVGCLTPVKKSLCLTFRTAGLQPPQGYDAVIGEPGGDLNYDECVGTCQLKQETIYLLVSSDTYCSIQRE